MAELKTRPTTTSVKGFIDCIGDEQRRAECRKLLQLMRRATGQQPKLWGNSIVGFGKYHYEYPSGREGDWFVTGFSPRKQALTLYIMSGFSRYQGLLKKLGKFKTGKSCLYVKRLEDIDEDTLDQLVSESVKHIKQLYP